MQQPVIRRTYITIAAAILVTVVADQLAQRAPVVAGYMLGSTATGAGWERAIMRPDPSLLATRNIAWLVAVCLAVWLTTHELVRITNGARRRWLPLASATGLIVGLLIGGAAWRLERPGTTLTPGEASLIAVTTEVHSILGPLDDLVSPAIQYAGHDAWLVLAPMTVFYLYGAAIGVAALMLRALLALRPNDR